MLLVLVLLLYRLFTNSRSTAQFGLRSVAKMKSFVVLAVLVALALGSSVPSLNNVVYKSVDQEFVARQKQILELFENIEQVNHEADYYKVGKDYNIEANLNKYENHYYVQEFLNYYRDGFISKRLPVSIYMEDTQNEIKVIYNLLYTAVDFDTFYKTAAFIRVYLNEIEFVNALYLVIIHKVEYRGLVVPALYEIVPRLFTNNNVIQEASVIQMLGENPAIGNQYGIFLENGNYVYNANYSFLTYPNEEQRLAYFTEDVGLNSYYALATYINPSWMETPAQSVLAERRGELFIYFYKTLLARYYLERLSNGLGEIPEFSWRVPLQTGYYPSMYYWYSFVSRQPYYHMNIENNAKYIQILETYEQLFLGWLNFGSLNLHGQQVDFKDPKSINFVGNYWQGNADLYGKLPSRGYNNVTYTSLARYILSGAPEELYETILPNSLAFPESSLRDPVFYQLYNRIWNYISMYLDYLPSYTPDQLRYPGIKIKDVKVDKLITFFDLFEYDITNSVYLRKNQFESSPRHIVRQPRLDHKPFSVTIDVKSEVASEVVVKMFLGPKHDSNGNILSLEDNWMNFVELDWFTYNLTQGQNQIVRESDDFFFYRQDSVPVYEIEKLLGQGKVPKDMADEWFNLPNRLMLPKGTSGGYPYQIFVVVYPFQGLSKEYQAHPDLFVDNKPFGYPLDRPVDDSMFLQPNMYLEDVLIYQEGPTFAYELNTPYYHHQRNVVSKK